MGRSRIRLRLANGAELETEGEAEFVRQESQRLLGVLGQGHTPPARTLEEPSSQAGASAALWKEIAELQKGGLVLRAKPAAGQTEDACLLLLGAARALLGQDKPTATQLARWLRQSSFPFGRLDRILAEAVRRRDLLGYGFRRSRRYELTPAGVSKAALLAHRHLP